MMQEGVVLGHFISPKGIEVDPAKIEVIHTLSVLAKLKEVRSFLWACKIVSTLYQRF